jgi:hypothetical protein
MVPIITRIAIKAEELLLFIIRFNILSFKYCEVVRSSVSEVTNSNFLISLRLGYKVLKYSGSFTHLSVISRVGSIVELPKSLCCQPQYFLGILLKPKASLGSSAFATVLVKSILVVSGPLWYILPLPIQRSNNCFCSEI